MSRACQRCGAVRDAARFCNGCGLDFWKAAAEEAAPVADAVPAPVQRPQGGIRVGVLAVGVGAAMLVVAGGLWVITTDWSGSFGSDRPPRVAPLPSVHPLLTAFYHEARDPDAAFHVEQDATVELSDAVSGTIDITARGSVYGDDMSVAMSIIGPEGSSFQGRVVIVDDRPYVRLKGEAWQAGARLPAAARASANPFAPIKTVTELDYVGTERRDGMDGHLLVTETWLGSSFADDLIRTVGRITDREARTEIFVDDEGVPQSAVYTFRLEASSGDQRLVVTGTSTFVFSEWGSVDPVEPPIASP